jgi:hypothetical protein
VRLTKTTDRDGAMIGFTRRVTGFVELSHGKPPT